MLEILFIKQKREHNIFSYSKFFNTQNLEMESNLSNNENLKQGVTFSFFSVEVREIGSNGLLSRPSGNGNAPVMISGHQGEVNPIRELIDIMNSENNLTLQS